MHDFNKAKTFEELDETVDKVIDEIFGWYDKFKRHSFHLSIFKDWVKKVNIKLKPIAIFAILIKSYLKWGRDSKPLMLETIQSISVEFINSFYSNYES